MGSQDLSDALLLSTFVQVYLNENEEAEYRPKVPLPRKLNKYEQGTCHTAQSPFSVQRHTVVMRSQACHFNFLGVNYRGLNWVLKTIWQMQPFCEMLKNRSQPYKIIKNLNHMMNS